MSMTLFFNQNKPQIKPTTRNGFSTANTVILSQVHFLVYFIYWVSFVMKAHGQTVEMTIKALCFCKK